MEEVQPDGSSNESKVVLTILAASSATALKMQTDRQVTEDRGVVVLQETSLTSQTKHRSINQALSK
jgi:hypothetical protein